MKRKSTRILLTILGLLLAIYIVAALLSQPVANNAFASPNTPLVIAHQGGEKLWPSNTIYAFQRAAEMGVDVLEMDVHATSDGMLVLMHDDTVDRTTDGTGRIVDLTLTQLQALDAGEYWTADDGATFPFANQGIIVPTLEEMFQRFPDFPMNIEIKQREPSIAASMCSLIRQYDKSDQVLVASFHLQSMNEFREACPEVATSSVENEIRIFFGLNSALLGATYPPVAHAFQVPEFSGGIHVVTPRFVNGAQNHNVAVHVWTVNETADMERFVQMGVDGIITDRPDRLMALLGR